MCCLKGFKFNPGEIVDVSTGKIKIIANYRKNSYKYVRYLCLNCNQEDVKFEGNLVKGTGCRVCSNQKCVAGINDIATTDPQIASMMASTKDKYKYTKFSTKKVDWKCPICGTVIKNIQIRQVSAQRKISCPYCSSGISYPNRIMNAILTELDEDFLREFSPKWAINMRYDFWLYKNNMKYFIEMDGGFGHGNKGTETQKREQIKIDKKKDTLARMHGIKMIRIDCNYLNQESAFDYIIKNILNSELKNILCIDNINFENIRRFAEDKIVYEVCKMFNDGVKKIHLIAEHFKIHPVTVSRYLKRGATIGLCEYSSKVRYNDYKDYNNKKIFQFDSQGNFISDFKSIKDASICLGIHRSSISRCLNGHINSVKGYNFKCENEINSSMVKLNVG